MSTTAAEWMDEVVASLAGDPNSGPCIEPHRLEALERSLQNLYGTAEFRRAIEGLVFVAQRIGKRFRNAQAIEALLELANRSVIAARRALDDEFTLS